MAPTHPATATAKTTPKKVPATEPQQVVPKMEVESVSFSNKVKSLAADARSASVRTIKDPQVQVSAASAMAGSVVFGACGGAVGVLAGGILGLPLALFTFGLSIPVSAAVGGGLGVVAGGAAGCTTGGVGGYSIYKWRKDIHAFFGRSWLNFKSTTQSTRVFVECKVGDAQRLANEKFVACKSSLTSRGQQISAVVKERTTTVAQKAQTVATDPHAQVTAASAAAGGVALGMPCGAIGLVGGAVVGLVPALFTFGLSIPVFAVVGGGAGLCVGGTAGAAGAGAVGYGLYAKKAEIRQGATDAATYVNKLLGRP